MTLTSDLTIAEIATAAPATISVFQRHRIDFCCGGKVPLAVVCQQRGLALDAMMGELRASMTTLDDHTDWTEASLTSLIAHIQAKYHAPLREELPRIAAMLAKVVSRHGKNLPDTLPAIQQTFGQLHDELLDHMTKEDRILFPAIVAIEKGDPVPVEGIGDWIARPIEAMEAEHAEAGVALARIRELAEGFTPPGWACPTFRGLYYALAQLETDMHLHVFLENHVLFPRAAQLANRC
jgi:regulator of cell morphogenesis and NO signaling